MKDSRQVRSEYQSFVDAYGKIAEASVQPEEDRKRLTKSNPEGTPRNLGSNLSWIFLAVDRNS